MSKGTLRLRRQIPYSSARRLLLRLSLLLQSLGLLALLRAGPERCSNRRIFMNSALNTEVGSLNRIEYLTLRTIQFYSSGPAIADYS